MQRIATGLKKPYPEPIEAPLVPLRAFATAIIGTDNRK
jgi:hypothetical protein